jgi:hypothetical protein
MYRRSEDGVMRGQTTLRSCLGATASGKVVVGTLGSVAAFPRVPRPATPEVRPVAGVFCYLFTPVVGVFSGVCVAPDFGMTVSFIFVGGIFG